MSVFILEWPLYAGMCVCERPCSNIESVNFSSISILSAGITYATVPITHSKAFADLVYERETLFHIMRPGAVHRLDCGTAILYKNSLIDTLRNNKLLPCQVIVKLVTL